MSVCVVEVNELTCGADMLDAMQPEHVAPLVLWLCHEDCSVTGQLFECGGGWMARCKCRIVNVYAQVHQEHSIIVTQLISFHEHCHLCVFEMEIVRMPTIFSVFERVNEVQNAHLGSDILETVSYCSKF